MSLLMDALKKAEKEKKEAAQKKTGQHAMLDTGEYSANLEDSGQFSNISTDSHEIPVGLDTREMSLELEPLSETIHESFNNHNTNQEDDDSVEFALENTAEHEINENYNHNNEQTLVDDNTSTQQLGFENTEEYQSVKARIEQDGYTAFDDSFDSSYEDTLEDRRFDTEEYDNGIAYQETLAGITATELTQDIGQFDGQPTPVAANTVFEATKSTSWANKTGLSLAIAMVVLVVVATAILIHIKTTPDVPNVPSPMVAKDMQPVSPVALPEITPTPSVEEVVQDARGLEPSNGDVETEQVIHEELPLTGEAEWGPLYDKEALTAKLEKEQETGKETDLAEHGSSVSQAIDVARLEKEVSEIETYDEYPIEDVVTAPITAPVTPAMIKISRIKKDKPEVSINQQAYDAYQQGNYDVASSMYQLSLEKTPGNRDALLGLAAINMRRNQPEVAYMLYQQVLKLNPKDTAARVALVNIQGSHNIANNESLLKLLLKDNPDSANTYFSLGNLYAKQQRWPEAQLAFFEAYSRHSKNPDYAMNLAVSLDQMGQAKAALQYYNKAIELADKETAGFNPSSVLSRIKSLTEGDS